MPTKLAVKEIFGPTIQGEGAFTGSPAIFIRFAGCNMWSGHEKTRADSKCPFCDTDFINGDMMEPAEVAREVLALTFGNPYIVVFTGGEPLLQSPALLQELATLLIREGYSLHLETNGAVKFPDSIMSRFDHVTCSPKLPVEECKINWDLVDCIKVLYPHPNPAITPENFNKLGVQHNYIQPIDSHAKKLNTANALQKVKQLGMRWSISVQVHKVLGEEG
jgi:organic radical activating enzyme